jgi:hypothetical protein
LLLVKLNTTAPEPDTYEELIEEGAKEDEIANEAVVANDALNA